jgi:hypothetical protein
MVPKGKMFFKFPTIAMLKYHKKQKRKRYHEKQVKECKQEPRLVTSRTKAKVNFLL